MDEERTFLMEIKAYDIEISYYKFNVISAFQKYRTLLRANFYLSLPAYIRAVSREFRSLRCSVKEKRGKDRE